MPVTGRAYNRAGGCFKPGFYGIAGWCWWCWGGGIRGVSSALCCFRLPIPSVVTNESVRKSGTGSQKLACLRIRRRCCMTS